MLAPLIALPSFRIANRRALERALSLYGWTTIGCGDALIVASMEQAGSAVLYSYDRHFDAFAAIVRQEPRGEDADAPGLDDHFLP